MQFPAIYTDDKGAVSTFIENDGKTLRLVIDGLTFEGRSFDGLAPTDVSQLDEHSRFFLHPSNNDLCNCTLSCEIPVLLRKDDVETVPATLRLQLRLGKPDQRNTLDEETATFLLDFDGFTLRAPTSEAFFESGMAALQKQLPANYHFFNCFGCTFGDYHIFGHGLFGDLCCFRSVKEAYRRVRTKEEYAAIVDDFTQQVQETYLCPEFEVRPPNTGYRG